MHCSDVDADADQLELSYPLIISAFHLRLVADDNVDHTATANYNCSSSLGENKNSFPIINDDDAIISSQ